MIFDGKRVVYTRENAAENDKKLPQLHSLSIKQVVDKNGLAGLDGVDVTLVHGKRSVYVHDNDWLETQGNKKDYTHGDVAITCEGETDEQIDKDYTRQVGQDTWKTNKGDTILHYTGEMTEVHTSNRHLEEPESMFERMNNKFGWGIARLDMWIMTYNLIVNISTSWFKWNADFRLIDSAFKLALSEHIGVHFSDKEANVEVKGAEHSVALAKSDVKAGSVEAGAAEAHEIGLTQNLGTVGPNSNI